MPRHISLENVYNFRDLGGYETPYGETSFSILYRSGSLAFCSENDAERIKNLGIKTIIDLRNDEDKEKHPDSIASTLGIDYIPLEVNGKGRIARNKEDMVDSYMEMLDDKESAYRIFKTILVGKKPLVFHCNAGKDRTGVVAAIILLANGVPFEQINADYLLSLSCLNKLVGVTLEKFPDFPKEVLYPDTFFLYEFKARFEKEYKSVKNYMLSIGFNDDEYADFAMILQG